MRKIAIVDDNKEWCQQVADIVDAYIKESGEYISLSVFHNSKALVYELEEKEKYDVFLLDIDMPEISGMELAKYIRQFLRKHILFLLLLIWILQ